MIKGIMVGKAHVAGTRLTSLCITLVHYACRAISLSAASEQKADMLTSAV
jgi:hypothetical protein